ncbi:hypothetical protein UlMin_025660 [Ulmus minor]
MDKSWMGVDRTSSKHDRGVESFLNFAIKNASGTILLRCPCTKCGNMRMLDPKLIKCHLFTNGILESYTFWFWHGESCIRLTQEVDSEPGFDFGDGVNTIGMVVAFCDEYCSKPDAFVKLLEDVDKPLYVGCSKFSVLSSLARQYNLKAKYGWSDNSFSELLSLVSEFLPKGNDLPTSMYEAKKTLSTLGMGYTKFHACLNDCMLYRGEFEEVDSCPTCGVPAKVLWYFPPIPRFKRMFATKKIAKDLTWHNTGRQIDSCIRHPVDSPTWKLVDHKWPDFGCEPRNLRLALLADGFNPFSNFSTQYSC